SVNSSLIFAAAVLDTLIIGVRSSGSHHYTHKWAGNTAAVGPERASLSALRTAFPMILDLERPGRARLLDLAAERWQAMREARPDFEPALDLQRRLLTIVIDVMVAVDASPLPRLSLPPRYLAAKLGRGVPALAGEPIPLPV